MGPKAFILVDQMAFGLNKQLARSAAMLGYMVFVVFPPQGFPTGQAAENVEFIKNEDWTIDGLRSIVDMISTKYKVAALASAHGFFSTGSLVCELAEDLGYKTGDKKALMLANNKYLMRRELEAKGVYTVRYHLISSEADFESAAQKVGFPMILKPFVGLGSSFISKVNNLQEIRSTFAHFREKFKQGIYTRHFEKSCFEGHEFDPTAAMLAEEAIDGVELSVECLCTEDEIFPLIVHDKLDVVQEAYCSFENLLITPPIRISAEEVQKVKAYAVDVLSALGLRNTFVHFELRFDSQDRPSVIEVNPRIGGMRVIDSLKTLTNIDYYPFFVRQMSGEALPSPQINANDKYWGMLAIYARNSGTIRAVHGLDEAARIRGVVNINNGYPIGAQVSGEFEEAFVVDAWITADTADEIVELDRKIKRIVELQIE